MKPLSGKIVLVTGASRGLGVEIARAFAARGCRLALAARSAEGLEAARRQVGGEPLVVPTDVRDLGSLRALVTRIEAALGPIDILVNNAGIEQVCDFEAMDPADVEAIVTTNVTGVLWLTRLVLPGMIQRKAGHVCNISSLAGLNAVPHNAVYSASKHALVGFSRSLRLEMSDHGVEVSVVCPGFVTGGMFLEWGREAPAGIGAVTPEDVARAVLRAVERNRAVAPVAKGLGKIGHWVEALSPALAESAQRQTGMVGYMRDQARRNAEKAQRG